MQIGTETGALEQPEGTRIPPRRSWLRILLVSAGILAGIVVLALVGLRLYFNDDYIKAQLQQVIKDELGRESTIGGVQVSLISGTVTIDDLHVLNAEKIFGDPDTFRVKKLHAQIKLFPLILSSAKKIDGLKIEIEKPEFLVEYKGTWPVEKCNISDLQKRFKSDKPGTWPKQSGLQALGCELIIKDGLFRMHDEELGGFTVPLTEATVKQVALGQPADAKIRLKLKTPHADGSADVDCRINWLGVDGSIDPGKFKDVLVSLKLAEMDLGFLGRFKQFSGYVGEQDKYSWTLGKPYSGSVTFNAPALTDAKFNARLETESVISLWEAQKWAGGRIPGRCEIEVQSGWDGTSLKQGNSRFELLLAESRAALDEKSSTKLLQLEISGDTSKPTSIVNLTFNSQMDRLFSTDVGAMLNLKGKIGGGLTGNIRAEHAPDGRVDAKCEFRTDKAYVATGDLRQPTSFLMSGDAVLFPGDDGMPERAEINNLMTTADSFEFRSLQPVSVTKLRDFEKMTTDAKLKISVKGREFWRQFQPLLVALNKPDPIEEELDGQLALTIGSGKLKLRLDSSIKQQSDTPEPLLLIARGEFNIAQAEATDSFEVQLSSLTRPLSIQAGGTLTRGKTQRVLELAKLNASVDHVAMQALDARFGKHGRLWVPAGVQLACGIQNTGALKMTQTLGADGKVISEEMTLQTKLAISNVALNLRDSLSNQLISFSDKEVSLSAEVLQKDMNVSITALKVQGSGFSMETRIDQADMSKLAEAMSATTLILAPPKAAAGETPEAYVRRTKSLDDARANHVKLWSAALPGTRVDLKINPIGLAQLTAIMPKLGQLPAADVVLGIEYQPATQKAAANLAITRNKATVPVTVNIDIQELLTRANGMLPILAGGAFTPNHLVDLSPRIVLNAKIPAEILKEFTNNALPPAETTINVEYNSTTRHLLSSVELNGPALSMKAETDADIPSLVERLIVLPTYPPGTKSPLAPFIDLIPVLTVDARANAEGATALLTLAGSPEPLGVGEWIVQMQYDPKTALLKVSKLGLTNDLINISGNLSELSLPALAKSIDADAGNDLEKWMGALPGMALEFKASPKGIERLKSWNILPDDKALAGDFAATLTLDRATATLNIDAAKFSGTDAEVKLSSRNIDLKALAAFSNLIPEKQKDPAQLAKLLPDLNIDMVARAPFVESIARRADARLNAAGDLGVKVKYDRAADELTLERVAFVRDAKSTFPVMALECLGSVSQVRTLLTRLDAQPKDLLPHFKNFSMPKLMVQGKDAVELLQKFKIGEELTAEVSAGKIVLDQPLALNNLNIRNAGTPESFNVSFTASTPITMKSGAQKTAEFAGTWRFDEQAPLRVYVAGNAFKATGTLNLDDADIFAAAPTNIDGAKKSFKKSAGMACKINFSFEQDASGGIAVPSLELRGGPIQLTLLGLAFHKQKPKLLLDIESLVFPDGRITKLHLDEGADKLKATIHFDAMDVAQFIPAGMLQPGVTVSAKVSGTAISYDGSYQNFKTDAPASALQLAINKIDMQAGVAMAGQSGSLTLVTPLNGTLAGLSAPGLEAGLIHDLGGRKTELKLGMGMTVTPRPGHTMLSAAQAGTLPLMVQIPAVTISSPVQLTQLLESIEALSGAFATPVTNAPVKSKAQSLEGIRDLRVQLGVAGPPTLAVTDTVALKDVKVETLVLDGLKAEVSSAQATIFGDARALIRKSTLNLLTDDYSGQLRIDDLNLHTVTTLDGKAPTKEEYQLFGRLAAEIAVFGKGITAADLRALVCQFDMRITDLVAEKNGGIAPEDLKTTATKVGLNLLGDVLGKTAGSLGRKLNWAVVIFTEDFGLFLPRLEFETLDMNQQVVKDGKLNLKGSLIGKGKSAGLQIDLKGTIDVVTNTFAPNLQLHLMKLPEKTQKAMRLDQVSEADRAALLAEFAAGKFQPIVLTGDVSNYKQNLFELVRAFSTLEDRIAAMIEAKKKADQAAAAAAAPAPEGAAPPPATPPPAQSPPAAGAEPPPKKTAAEEAAEGLRSLFGDKKKKK